MGRKFKFLIIFIIIGASKNLFASAKTVKNKQSGGKSQEQNQCQETVKDIYDNDICLGDIYEDPVEYKSIITNRRIKCVTGYFKDINYRCRKILKRTGKQG
ncbi:hypothetical protein ACKWTF_006128 [Chironomus riparius]